MKKRILNLIVALVFGSASIFATNVPSITTKDAKSLIVDTKDWKSAFISIEIRSEEGELIFDNKFSTQKGKRLSFKNIPNGQYSIVLSNNLKSMEQFFILNSNELVILPNIVTVFKPIFDVKENYIDLNYLAPGQNASISISDDKSTFFNVKYENQKSINKRFETSELPSGTYTISVYSNNSSYSKTFYK